jgi:hypothetical protein
MSDDRKKSLWLWIVALLIGLPVLYVASFGPACQLADRGIIPDTATTTLYHPLGLFLANCCSEAICNVMIDYGIEDGVDRGGLPTAPSIILGAYRGRGK